MAAAAATTIPMAHARSNNNAVNGTSAAAIPKKAPPATTLTRVRPTAASERIVAMVRPPQQHLKVTTANKA